MKTQVCSEKDKKTARKGSFYKYMSLKKRILVTSLFPDRIIFSSRSITCVQSFYNFRSDVEGLVSVQQVVETGVADDQAVAFVLIVDFQE